MANQRPDYKRAFRIIRDILNQEWDPICAACPEDEYDDYILALWRLLVNEAPDAAIAEHLGKIESEQIGLPPRPELNLQIARRLRDGVTGTKA